MYDHYERGNILITNINDYEQQVCDVIDIERNIIKEIQKIKNLKKPCTILAFIIFLLEQYKAISYLHRVFRDKQSLNNTLRFHYIILI